MGLVKFCTALDSHQHVHKGFQEHQCAYSKRRSIGRQTPLHRKPSELYNRAQGDTVLQSAAKEQLPPWLLGFQCNERYLKWGDSAQTQLLKIYAARELGKDVGWVDEQLAILTDILPDLVSKLSRMKASLLLALVRDTQAIANKMVQLKALLPSLNASVLVADCPSLLLSHDIQTIETNLIKFRGTLEGRTDVESLVEREPLLLLADVDALVAEAERLLPSGQDPMSYLVANPGTLLDMQQAGLPSAIDGNLWTESSGSEL